MLLKAFRKVNLHLDKLEFCASQRWLVKFKQRNNIVCGFSIVTTDAFKSTLPDKLLSYEPRDIFNGNEVGLFRKQSGRKTLLTKDEDPAGRGTKVG